jgi:hypothetical protein
MIVVYITEWASEARLVDLTNRLDTPPICWSRTRWPGMRC